MHDITPFLEKRHVAKDIRGRLFAYPGLEPATTALVIIDMQNVFLKEGQLVEVPTAREMVPTVNTLSTAARAAGMTVIWTRQTLDPAAKQTWPIFFRFGMTPEREADYLREMGPGGEGHALYPDLVVEDSDIIVDKACFSAFAPGSSPIDAVLRERGIKHIIIAGTVTNVCCESTARDAYFLNYRIIFGSDVTAALTDDEHNATLLNMHNFFGDVRSSEEILAALTHNEHRFAQG